MGKISWKWNVASFAELRNHPTLVSAMESAADTAAAGTRFEVQVERFPHAGRRTGARTSVQIWAQSYEARLAVNRQPGELTAALGRVSL